ncbi:MAG TPA: MFS transporter, partial [Candidatus Eremiobacteraeota bacterium]|nr:MFS transporter [Candidatus Eremiobacteraeota bacterium]
SFLPRLGYKKAMLIALTIVTLACIVMPLAGGFTMTKILFICVGVSFALIKVSVYSTVSLITKDSQDHASFMSTLEGIFQIGVLTGYWIFGFFMSHKSMSWLDTYWILAVMSFCAFILLLTTTLDESSVKIKKATIAKDFINMIGLIRLPLVLIFIFTAFLYVFIEQGIQSWLPTFNNKILYLPDAMSVQVTSILAGAIALGRIFGGYIMKKVRWLYVLIGSLIGSIILVILVLPLSTGIQQGSVTSWFNAPPVAFIFPLIGFFLAPIYPTLCSTVLSKLPKANQSAMSGLIVIFSALGGTIGSRITGTMFGLLGGIKAFYFSLIPMALLLIIIFPYKKIQDKFIMAEGEK